jgi:hypothetical protein
VAVALWIPHQVDKARRRVVGCSECGHQYLELMSMKCPLQAAG